MILKLHPTQQIVAKDNHDFRVVVCGRQWGKTSLAVEEMTACGYSQGGKEIGYLASTFDQARNIAWVMLKDKTNSIWVKPPNESRLELTIHTQDGGESRLTLGGYENIETYRGRQFDFLVPDEVALMRNFEYNWHAVLEPTLAFRRGKALFLGTPKGFDHLYKLYLLGQEEGNSYYKSWRFTSYDNPFLPKERIEQARATSTEDYFAQEYLADFRKATGLAHKPWDRKIHLIAPFDVPDEWQRGRGFDYGSAHPTASLRIAIDTDDNWFLERSYSDSQRIIEQHADVIKAEDYGLGFIPCWGDPSGAQWFMEFKKYDLNIEPANKEVGQGMRGWVEHCIEKVNERLKPQPGHLVILPDGRKIENAPKLFIIDIPENQKTVQQIENLKWRETRTGEIVPVLDEENDPTGGHFDLCAALRYFAVSYKKRIPLQPETEFGGVKPYIEGVG